jgi:hypothetical protein
VGTVHLIAAIVLLGLAESVPVVLTVFLPPLWLEILALDGCRAIKKGPIMVLYIFIINTVQITKLQQ